MHKNMHSALYWDVLTADEHNVDLKDIFVSSCLGCICVDFCRVKKFLPAHNVLE